MAQRSDGKEQADRKYTVDIEFLLGRFEADAGAVLKLKGIDWGAVRREFTKPAERAEAVSSRDRWTASTSTPNRRTRSVPRSMLRSAPPDPLSDAAQPRT